MDGLHPNGSQGSPDQSKEVLWRIVWYGSMRHTEYFRCKYKAQDRVLGLQQAGHSV